MDHLIDDSDRLKPCPFCGGEAEFGECAPADENDNAGAQFISCTKCDATTALVFPCMDSAKTVLMERWNKRSTAPAASKSCEQLGMAVVDSIADDGCRNATGGIYQTRVQEFATEVQRAFAQQNGLQVRGLAT